MGWRMNIVAHNLLAMNTSRQLGIVTKNNSKSTEKLSSGYRINKAADDAAGLTISEKMRAQIRGLNKGETNTQDGISVCQVADGALSEVSDMLHRMSELSIQASNDTNTASDRRAIQEEIEQLIKEIDRISDTTEFNTMPIFKGTVEYLTNANGTPAIWGQIPISDFTLADVSLGKTPFGSSDNGDHLALQAIVKNPDSVAYGKNFNLIFGNGSTSSSSFRIRYMDANNVSQEQSCSIRDLSSTNYHQDTTNPDAPSWSRDFVYSDTANGINITITQKVEAVTLSDDEKTYKISYGITNNSTQNVDLDFMFHADTAYNNNDTCEGYFVNNNRVNQFSIYSDANSPFTQGSTSSNVINGIPNSFSIVDVDQALSFSEKIAFNSGLPDSLSVGYYNSIDEWDYYKDPIGNGALGSNSEGRDLGFSLLWNDALGANGGTVNYSFDYGIIATETDTNINNIPIKKDNTVVSNHYNEMKMWIQSGARENDGMFINFGEINSNILGISNVNVETYENAQHAIDSIQNAVININTNRSNIGAQQNRLEATARNVANISENTQAAESRLRDTDMAAEMVEFSKNNILIQAGQAMLTQANSSLQNVVRLLQ